MAWEQFFETCDVLLVSCFDGHGLPALRAGTPLKVDGKEVDYQMVSAHGALFNYSGHPAFVLPCGLRSRRIADRAPACRQALG